MTQPFGRVYLVGAGCGPQEDISQTLISLAQAGHTVVRLKGGDPFVFGRGGEEIQALQRVGIPFEVVPGISSAIAIPGQAGIPVTHRGLSRSFHVITAHTKDGASDQLDRLAGAEGTLVILMGLSQLPAIVQRLEAEGYEVVEQILLADDAAALKTTLTRLADQRQLDLILTTGGTGFGPRDVTPEATMAVATRLAPGIAEAIRAASLAITPRAMLSRAVSVIRGKTLIVNLPGSPKAVCESMDVFLPQMPHALGLLRGEVRDCAR